MSEKYDVIVIGAGPGGYVAAIKAAKLGFKTAVIEAREAGGTCLNRGCIPAKAMIHAAEVYRSAKECERFGIHAENVTFDFEKIFEYKEETTKQLVSGVEGLFKGNEVDQIAGKGTSQLRREGNLRRNVFRDKDSRTGRFCENADRRRRSCSGCRGIAPNYLEK